MLLGAVFYSLQLIQVKINRLNPIRKHISRPSGTSFALGSTISKKSVLLLLSVMGSWQVEKYTQYQQLFLKMFYSNCQTRLYFKIKKFQYFTQQEPYIMLQSQMGEFTLPYSVPKPNYLIFTHHLSLNRLRRKTLLSKLSQMILCRRHEN